MPRRDTEEGQVSPFWSHTGESQQKPLREILNTYNWGWGFGILTIPEPNISLS